MVEFFLTRKPPSIQWKLRSLIQPLTYQPVMSTNTVAIESIIVDFSRSYSFRTCLKYRWKWSDECVFCKTIQYRNNVQIYSPSDIFRCTMSDLQIAISFL